MFVLAGIFVDEAVVLAGVFDVTSCGTTGCVVFNVVEAGWPAVDVVGGRGAFGCSQTERAPGPFRKEPSVGSAFSGSFAGVGSGGDRGGSVELEWLGKIGLAAGWDVSEGGIEPNAGAEFAELAVDGVPNAGGELEIEFEADVPNVFVSGMFVGAGRAPNAGGVAVAVAAGGVGRELNAGGVVPTAAPDGVFDEAESVKLAKSKGSGSLVPSGDAGTESSDFSWFTFSKAGTVVSDANTVVSLGKLRVLGVRLGELDGASATVPGSVVFDSAIFVSISSELEDWAAVSKAGVSDVGGTESVFPDSAVAKVGGGGNIGVSAESLFLLFLPFWLLVAMVSEEVDGRLVAASAISGREVELADDVSSGRAVISGVSTSVAKESVGGTTDCKSVTGAASKDGTKASVGLAFSVDGEEDPTSVSGGVVVAVISGKFAVPASSSGACVPRSIALFAAFSIFEAVFSTFSTACEITFCAFSPNGASCISEVAASAVVSVATGFLRIFHAPSDAPPNVMSNVAAIPSFILPLKKDGIGKSSPYPSI